MPYTEILILIHIQLSDEIDSDLLTPKLLKNNANT